jgi:hypothetical protein
MDKSAKITIKIKGREDETPKRPALLSGTSRAADGAGSSDFLPDGYVQVTRSFDVGAAARAAEGAATHDHDAAPGEVVVLELEDGSTLITSAERLRDSLRRNHPEWWTGETDANVIPFEKMRAEGAALGRGFGEAVGGLVSKVFTLAVGEKTKDGIVNEALAWLKGRGVDAAELGVSRLGTQALMWAIERRLFKGQDKGPDKDASGHLYRWVGASGNAERDLETPLPDELDRAAADKQPMLVFVHGTASSSLGSFGELRAGDRDLWAILDRYFTGGIYAFEHRTLSASPIDNALDLARALPRGACISLVSHSSGGLVADLLCLTAFDRQIDAFARPKNMPGLGGSDSESDARKSAAELDAAYATQRDKLRELATVLQEKQFVVQRYVRTASPANGTKLASANFDLFLSSILTLIGQVPFFFGSPFYAAFKRVVIEIAKNRTNPHLVPGIEALLPDSPMARLLLEAPVREGIAMAVIAGDIEGGNLLKRMGVLLTDFLLFDRDDNDLVVNTTAMLAGVAPRAGARVLFDRGADVSHFRYFTNVGTRSALRDWLVRQDPAALDAFHPLPDPKAYEAALAAASRDALATDRPVVVILPGMMGSHLQVHGNDRVWFDPLDLAAGGLTKIVWGQRGVEAEDLFGMSYGELCKDLAASHRVERFAYDWRQPLDVLGERLGEFLDQLMKQTRQPIRLLAHSMGGLVVRACIHERRPVMDALMAREGARLIMLGTPHQGAHSMVENLLGKGDTLRMLVRLDVTHDMQEILDIVSGFRGALQLLPKPGFKDMFQGQDEGGGIYAYQSEDTWSKLFPPKVKDFWFGDGKVGKPTQDALDSASWLWRQDGDSRPSLPAEYENKSAYVFGVARSTPCGVREEGGRLRMVATSHGDGTVSWESGRIGGVGQFFYMPTAHGDLPATKEYFPALIELLTTGTTGRLATTPPASRAIEQPQPVAYDAGPPTVDDPDTLGRTLLGGSPSNRVPPRRKRRLEVSVHATDLRFLTQPILVGHYEQDAIAGPQRLIDRELLDGDLSERRALGLYAGPLGTAVAVLRVPNNAERARGSLRGAVVTGLGPYDGTLSLTTLTEAVRAGALRYLLQIIDVLGEDDRQVSLATLLLGYNSSANLSIEASVEALVRGVMEANARFYETTRLNIHIGTLDIVELYIDTAISAVYSLRRIEARLAALAERQQTQLTCSPELERGEGRRQRLFDAGGGNYWPRLIVTTAEGEDTRPDVPAGQAPATALADTLRFLYVGQRARAESVLQQRQPGLIERLVRQQIHDKVWNEDFGRMLFQLMVPHDFKDAARQLDQVVLVVDGTTANLPWELMLADDPMRTDGDKRPLALRIAGVRQLSSTQFRRQVRQNIERSALVIGNPSVKGFKEAFSTPQVPITDDPPDLPGAMAEAESVARLLTAMGYQVTPLIDGDAAAKVLAALYRRAWRILHVSAHGIFALRHADGRYRSGVVLSDGLLITAAEVQAMEVVPDVVFLNCCHLGTVDVGRQGNKLAASIARELIDIGVRCVVVAGWAVDDEGARCFGETFYQELLQRRRPFGEAVFEARKAVYAANQMDITWGAFQAYGDPSWRAEPRAQGANGSNAAAFASPEELLDELARIRAQQARRSNRMNERDTRAQVEALETMLKKRCPPGWLNAPGVQSALGAAWYDLGAFERAREALLGAVQAEDKEGTVPIHDIEKLANVEARLGERLAEVELRDLLEPPKASEATRGKPARRDSLKESAEALIALALERLHGLDMLLSAKVANPAGTKENTEEPSGAFNPERSAMIGSAYKREANLHAMRLLASERARRDGKIKPADRQKVEALAKDAGNKMVKALQASLEAYQRDEGRPGSGDFSSYLALNRLALSALTPADEGSDKAQRARDAAIELAKQCGQSAAQAFDRSSDTWDAVMQAEALLVEKLIDGTLAQAGEPGQAAFEKVVQTYAETMANVTIKPSQLDSVSAQMEVLSRFCDALSLTQPNGTAWRTTADRLLDLARRVQPGRRPREDRPGAIAPRPSGKKKSGRRGTRRSTSEKTGSTRSKKKY